MKSGGRRPPQIDCELPAMSFRAVAAALILSSCATGSLSGLDDMVGAERAFAADGYARGVKLSFLAFSAPDAVILNPEPVNARESLAASPDQDAGAPRAHLVWWPLYAGIANSGDLGFTTGPYAIDEARRGFYFTIWKRQPDGDWKWVLDAGVGADASGEAAQGSPVARLAASREKSASPQAATAEVAALEAAIADAAGAGLQSAYEPYLDADSRLHSRGPAPATSAAGRAAVFAARPQSLALAPIGGGASKTGDLVWTYGEGRWTDGGGDRKGYYVRVWQRRRAGWRLAFDEFLPPPAP